MWGMVLNLIVVLIAVVVIGYIALRHIRRKKIIR